MIVSLHMPKTGGMSFGELLGRSFGDRLLRDYADDAGYRTPELVERARRNAVAVRAARAELAARYDAIHGHFVADKYAGVFADGRFVAFFRDPVQQAISHYRFLQRNPQLHHPVVRVFHDTRPTLAEFVRWPATGNPQTMFLGSLAVEDLAFVGLREEFARSLALFARTMGRDLGSEVHANLDPESRGTTHRLDPATRRAVEAAYAADVELYRRARAEFARRCARHGV